MTHDTKSRTLLPQHLTDLRASGLTDETIEACGFYSEDNYARLATLLNRSRLPKRLSPALVFPFVGPDGSNGYCRIKPDRPRMLKGKPVKYESPTGRSNEIFIPPGAFAAIDDSAAEMLVVEGEKKAAKADQEGFPCLGLVGVFGWKDGKAERLLPVLDRIAWKDRQVRIVFDSDITSNPNVQAAESRLAVQLMNRGADVRCVRLPDLPDETKCGADDFLVHYSAGEFRKLLNEAIESEPIEAIEVKVPANQLDPATEVAEMLEGITQDGVCRLRFWRGSFYLWSKGAYREKDAAQVRSEVVQYLNQHARNLSTAVVANMLDQMRAQTMLSHDMDAPAWLAGKHDWPANELLVAQNGIYHLPSLVDGKPCHIDPTPQLFSTIALEYDLAADAKRPDAFLSFLEQLWPDDPLSIATLQELLGYLISGNTKQQKIAFLVGPKRSGKSTIGRIIQQLVGPKNTATPTLATLGMDFGLWSLVGRSVAIIADARISGRSDRAIVTERLLSISGEDHLDIHRKYLQPLTAVKLPTRLVLLSNELPRLVDASGALASRMIVLRMQRSWYGSEDTGLFDRLLPEMPGILLWAIGGWKRLRDRGHFIQPESGRELLEDMYELSSPITAFVDACCELGPEHRIPRNELYERYTEWCEEGGKMRCADQAGFGRDLRAAFSTLGSEYPRIGGKRVRCYSGINLRMEW